MTVRTVTVFLLNEVPCVKVVYMGCFVHGIFQSTSVFSQKICFNVDTELSLYNSLVLFFGSSNILIVFSPSVNLCHCIEVTVFFLLYSL